jgi:hypothetical protein
MRETDSPAHFKNGDPVPDIPLKSGVMRLDQTARSNVLEQILGGL